MAKTPNDPNKPTAAKDDKKRRIRGQAKSNEKVGRTEIAEHHVAYAEFGQNKGWYFENPSEEPYFPTGNPKVWLRWDSGTTRSQHRDFMLNFGSLTEKELEVFREFINWSIDRAMPHARSADERAQQEGTSVHHPRLMRRLPVFATRERGVREYREGVPSRPDWLTQADSDDLASALANGFGMQRTEVPDNDQEDGSAEHDNP